MTLWRYSRNKQHSDAAAPDAPATSLSPDDAANPWDLGLRGVEKKISRGKISVFI